MPKNAHKSWKIDFLPENVSEYQFDANFLKLIASKFNGPLGY